jgi:hypothetical protein
MTIYVWKASGGREIPVSRMTDEHLINAINWCEKDRQSHYQVPNREQRSDGYFWLRQEAMKRGLRWRNYSDQLPLRDGDLTIRQRHLSGDEEITPLSWLIGKRVYLTLSKWRLGPSSQKREVSGEVESIEIHHSDIEPREVAQYQFPTYEDIARGYGGKHPRDRDEKEMPLRDLAPGGKFKLLPTSTLVMKGSSPSYIYMKTVPIGMMAQALRDRGCRMEHLWTRDGNLSSADSTVRCLVANLVKGSTFLIPADEVVMHYEGHRIG